MQALGLPRTIPILAASVAALALALCFGLAFDQIRTSAPVSTGSRQTVELVRRLFGERAVENAQQRLAVAPDDPQAMTRLAQAYLLRVRESGDPGYYSRADDLLRKSLAARPDDVEALVAAGNLALARHDFEGALQLGQRAVSLAPRRAAPYGVLTDALVELGRYDEAVATAQRMVDLRPDTASYARVSYLRELHGDLPGATAAMQRALELGAPTAEAAAWTEVHLGNLLYSQGDLDGAEQAYASALHRMDGYAYALAGLGRLRAGQGDLEAAATLYQRASELMPLPEHAAALADVYTRLGDDERAQRQYRLVEAIQQLWTANGVRAPLQRTNPGGA